MAAEPRPEPHLARLPQVVWYAAHDSSRAVQQGGFQQENGLLVQRLLPPVRRHEFGQEDGHHVLTPGRIYGVYVVNQHAEERAVRRRQHLERHAAMEPFPVSSRLCGFGRIDLHVDRLHVAGQPQGLFEDVNHAPVGTYDRDDHPVVPGDQGRHVA
jgi:hypothetical protein